MEVSAERRERDSAVGGKWCRTGFSCSREGECGGDLHRRWWCGAEELEERMAGGLPEMEGMAVRRSGGGGGGTEACGGGGGWTPSPAFLEQPLERENTHYFLQMTARICGGVPSPLIEPIMGREGKGPT